MEGKEIIFFLISINALFQQEHGRTDLSKHNKAHLNTQQNKAFLKGKKTLFFLFSYWFFTPIHLRNQEIEQNPTNPFAYEPKQAYPTRRKTKKSITFN